MGKLEKCDETSVQDLETEKDDLQKERDELAKRLADFEEKYNLMETNCKLTLFLLRPTECSIKLHTIMSGWWIVHIVVSQDIFSKNSAFFFGIMIFS